MLQLIRVVSRTTESKTHITLNSVGLLLELFQ